MFKVPIEILERCTRNLRKSNKFLLIAHNTDKSRANRLKIRRRHKANLRTIKLLEENYGV